MRRLLDSFDAVDGELQQGEQLRLLSVATELPLLDNSCEMLAEPYRDPLPWWLDGTLEVVAAETERGATEVRLFTSGTHASPRRGSTVPANGRLSLKFRPDTELATAAGDDAPGPGGQRQKPDETPEE